MKFYILSICLRLVQQDQVALRIRLVLRCSLLAVVVFSIKN